MKKIKKYIIACIIGLFIFPSVAVGAVIVSQEIYDGSSSYDGMQTMTCEAGAVIKTITIIASVAPFSSSTISISYEDGILNHESTNSFFIDNTLGSSTTTPAEYIFEMPLPTCVGLGVDEEALILEDIGGNAIVWGSVADTYIGEWDWVTEIADIYFIIEDDTEDVIVSNFTKMVNNAETGFASTTGFSVASAVGWSGDNIIMLFIGSGLSVLYELRYWIMALVIIYLVVFFGYRAFKFFRH